MLSGVFAQALASELCRRSSGGRAVPLPHLILLKHAVMRLYVSDDPLQRGAVGTRTSRHRGTIAALHGDGFALL